VWDVRSRDPKRGIIYVRLTPFKIQNKN
jgi:hypothetical protein